jgi:flagellar motor switch/type III secretory pathway protein FliN
LRPAETAALETAAALVARTLAAVLREYVGQTCAVTCVAAQCQWPTPNHEPGAVWGIPCGADSDHSPLWRLDGGLARGLVDCLLGAQEPLPAPLPAPVRPGLTRTEARVLGCLCRELHGAWSSCWPLRVAWPDQWRCITAQPDAPGPQCGEWARLSLAVEVCGLPGTVDAFLPLATARLPVAATGAEGGRGERLAGSQVRSAPVSAAAVLGTWHTTLRELTRLRPGQLVPLGVKPGAPLALHIAGSPKLSVQAGMHQGLVAVQVVDSEES